MSTTILKYTRQEDAPVLSTLAKSDDIPLWKRALDLACILIALPVLLPVGLLIALFIKIVSSGPVLFQQERVGFKGRRFLCLKFRTMKVDADTSVHNQHFKYLMASDKPMEKLDLRGDPRLIPAAWILRATGMDELPQLINVVKGQMSLVGPRPCIPYEYENYAPRHRRRCGTLPGLTGLWQVSGKNKTTFEQMMDLDLAYIQKRSLRLDLIILVRTIPAVMVQAYEVKIRREENVEPRPSAPEVPDQRASVS